MHLLLKRHKRSNLKTKNYEDLKDYKIRSSNFEILRIVSMYFIILGHFIGQGGGKNFPELYMWGGILGSGARIATNIFLMIGVWFLVDSDFRLKQIIKLYFTNFFYTSIITIIMFALGITSSIKQLINGFFPFLRRTNWFVILYICLLLLAPFLKGVFEWERCKIRKLIIILTFLIPVVCSVSAFMDTYLDNMLYFVYCYCLIGYIKKYCWKDIKINALWLILACLLYCTFAVSSQILTDTNVLQSNILRLVSQYLADFKSIPNMIISLTVFLYFSKIEIGKIKWINYLAANTLGVYCIHQVPCFYDYLWKGILKCEMFWNTRYAVMYTLIAAFCVFIFATFIDKLRIRLIETKFVKSKLYALIYNKLSLFYSGTY